MTTSQLRRSVGVAVRATSAPCLLIWLALAGAALGACGSDESDAQRPADLIGQSFISTSVTDSGEPRPLVEDTEITLSFDEREDRQIIRWKAGCNTFAADVEIGVGRLTVAQVAGTEIGCPEPLHRQDEWLAEFFGSDPRYELVDGVLVLRSGDVEVELMRGADETEPTEAATEPVPPGAKQLLRGRSGIESVVCSREARFINSVVGAYPAVDFDPPSAACIVDLEGERVLDLMLIRGKWVVFKRHRMGVMPHLRRELSR